MIDESALYDYVVQTWAPHDELPTLVIGRSWEPAENILSAQVDMIAAVTGTDRESALRRIETGIRAARPAPEGTAVVYLHGGNWDIDALLASAQR